MTVKAVDQETTSSTPSPSGNGNGNGTRNSPAMSVEGSFDAIVGGDACGWAFDHSAPEVPVLVRIIGDGAVLAEGVASIPRADLLAAGIGNGANGFSIPLPSKVWASPPQKIEACAAATGQILRGGPHRLEQDARYTYSVDGVDDGNVCGWLRDAADQRRVTTVELFEDDELIGRALTELPHELGGVGRFAIPLPQRLQDGKAHRFRLGAPEIKIDLGAWSLVTPVSGLQRTSPALPSFGLRELRDKTRAAKAGQTTTPSQRNAQVAQLQDELADTPGEHIEARYALTRRLGNLLVEQGKYEDALSVFEDAIAIDDTKPEAIAAVADTLLALGREQEARAYIDAQLEHQPEESAFLERADQYESAQRPKSIRVIAFYLPQFHRTPENDVWWGRGFTEWTNVTSGRPMFEGHLQPRRPTSLGYYDLRVPEAVNSQFELARRYDIDGFCYYYYWFHGKRILDRPLRELLEGKTGPFPFCLCWANEDWTRSWDGLTGEVLIAQEHTFESDVQFIQDIEPALRHPSYIRVNGKLLLIVYRADKLAEPEATIEAWRTYCRERGIGELYVCAAQSFGFDDPRPLGFDAAVEFPPHSCWWKYQDLHFYRELEDLPGLEATFDGKIYDYNEFADASMSRRREPYVLHRSSMLAWDNTARRGKTAHVYHDFSITKYEQWLSDSAAHAMREQKDPVVFVNAWNEWAEGAALEPDEFFGYELLEATRRAKRQSIFRSFRTYWRRGAPQFRDERVEQSERIILCGHDAQIFGAQVNLLNMARCLKRGLQMSVAILLLEGGELVAEYEKVGPTLVLGQEENWATAAKWLRHYKALGARKAICNTVASGKLVALLKTHEYDVVSLVHEMPALIASYGLEAACKQVAADAGHLVFASKIVADHFAQRYWPRPDKVLVAPQGIVFNPWHHERKVMRARVREELGFDADARIVMGCGYGDTRKGIDLFVQMAARVSRILNDQSVAFVWVGSIEDRLEPYVLGDIERSGLLERFHITGQVRDPGRYFIASDVFALTSREDPFPSVVMEAFDAYMPVVAFEGGGGYVDIVDDSTGALVPHLDVTAMSEAIAAFIEQEPRRIAAGERAHRVSRERFGYAPYMQKLLALMDGVHAADVASGSLKPVVWRHKQPQPKISAIIPTFNYGRYLELRLRTVLDQTLKPHEVIVVDDGSTDYSLALVEAMAAESDLPIHVIRSESNGGNPFVQWAKGIARATGDLIWLAEADDYCELTLLETLAKEFVDERVVMAWSDSIIVDDRGKSSGFEYKYYYSMRSGEMWHRPFGLDGKQLLEKCLLTENVVPNASAALFRRSAVPEDLSLIQEYKFSGDWWFWISVAEQGRVVYRPDALNYHRRHALSVMGDVLKSGDRLLPETMSFYERLCRFKPHSITPEVALRIFGRLDSLYEMFPELTEASPRLAEHPDFSSQYRSLLKSLDPLRALSQPPAPGDVLLVIAPTSEDDRTRAIALTNHLAASHRVHLFFVGDENSVLDFAEEVALPLESVTPLARKPKYSRSVNDTSSLASTAASVRNPLFVSFGVAADTVVVAHMASKRSPWLVVLSSEYDAFEEAAADMPARYEMVNQIIDLSSTIAYLTDNPPLPISRLAADKLTPLQRLHLRAERRRGDDGKRSPEAPVVRFIGIASQVPASTWSIAVQALTEASENVGLGFSLRIVAWGSDFGELYGRFANDDCVEVCRINDASADWSRIGDVGLDLSPHSLADMHRAWIDFVRDGVPTVALAGSDEQATSTTLESTPLLRIVSTLDGVQDLRESLERLLEEIASRREGTPRPVQLKWRLSPAGLDDVLRQAWHERE